MPPFVLCSLLLRRLWSLMPASYCHSLSCTRISSRLPSIGLATRDVSSQRCLLLRCICCPTHSSRQSDAEEERRMLKRRLERVSLREKDPLRLSLLLAIVLRTSLSLPCALTARMCMCESKGASVLQSRRLLCPDLRLRRRELQHHLSPPIVRHPPSSKSYSYSFVSLPLFLTLACFRRSSCCLTGERREQSRQDKTDSRPSSFRVGSRVSCKQREAVSLRSA